MNDFVFRHENDEIKFVGDFESLYQFDKDPWQQSSQKPSDMTHYYEFSRQNLIEIIQLEKVLDGKTQPPYNYNQNII